MQGCVFYYSGAGGTFPLLRLRSTRVPPRHFNAWNGAARRSTRSSTGEFFRGVCIPVLKTQKPSPPSGLKSRIQGLKPPGYKGNVPPGQGS